MTETERRSDAACDFRHCDKLGVRHFWFHHFCNEHNAYLRQKAHRENIQDLDSFVESHVKEGKQQS